VPEPIRGIHHITAIASDPQRNLDFYTQALGLRLVKLTVNFDDPGTYHFYFADADGRPGTILTFFPWPDSRPGRHGAGQVGVVGFTIPLDSVGFWPERLKRYGITTSNPFRRFEDEVISLRDPDGLAVELIASYPAGVADATDGSRWNGSPVPPEHAIRGFSTPTLLLTSPDGTAELLGNVFGLRPVGQSGTRVRFSSGEAIGGQVDIETRPDESRGGMGAGVVHHIAWRAPDDVQQLEWRELLVERGLSVTPVIDRQYFHSIYFREPGGILFEIATDPPGFTTDEPLEALGSGLKLPPQYESRRATIEAALPPLRLPERQGSN